LVEHPFHLLYGEDAPGKTLFQAGFAGKNLLRDEKRITGDVIVWQEEKEATCCGVSTGEGITKGRGFEEESLWRPECRRRRGGEAKEAKLEQKLGEARIGRGSGNGR